MTDTTDEPVLMSWPHDAGELQWTDDLGRARTTEVHPPACFVPPELARRFVNHQRETNPPN